MRVTPLLTALLLTGFVAGALPACSKSTPPPPPIFPSLIPPLNDAVVGEELVLRRGADTWRYSVIQVGDTSVVVESVRFTNGEPVASPERFEWPRNGFGVPDDAVIRKIERGRVNAGGHDWPCWLLHVHTRSRGRFYYWVTEAVGVNGVLKIAKDAEEGGPDDRHALYWDDDSLSNAAAPGSGDASDSETDGEAK